MTSSCFGILFCLSLTYVLTGGAERSVSFISEFMRSKPTAFLGTCIAVFIGGVCLFHVSAPLLGDSFFVINNLANTFRGAHILHTFSEPLGNAVFYFLLKLLGTVDLP